MATIGSPLKDFKMLALNSYGAAQWADMKCKKKLKLLGEEERGGIISYSS